MLKLPLKRLALGAAFLQLGVGVAQGASFEEYLKATEGGEVSAEAVEPKKPSKKKSRRATASKPLPPAKPALRESHEVPPVTESPQQEETRLTKNWGGPRSALSDRGIDIAMIYKGEFNKNFSGGAATDSTFLGNLDLRLSFDAKKLFGANGLSFFVYILGDHGGRPSSYVGDSMVSSNLPALGDPLNRLADQFRDLFGCLG